MLALCHVTTVVIDWDFTADFKLDVLAILTTFQTEFETNDISFESPNVELSETEIKLGVASF